MSKLFQEFRSCPSPNSSHLRGIPRMELPEDLKTGLSGIFAHSVLLLRKSTQQTFPDEHNRPQQRLAFCLDSNSGLVFCR